MLDAHAETIENMREEAMSMPVEALPVELQWDSYCLLLAHRRIRLKQHFYSLYNVYLQARSSSSSGVQADADRAINSMWETHSSLSYPSRLFKLNGLWYFSSWGRACCFGDLLQAQASRQLRERTKTPLRLRAARKRVGRFHQHGSDQGRMARCQLWPEREACLWRRYIWYAPNKQQSHWQG